MTVTRLPFPSADLAAGKRLAALSSGSPPSTGLVLVRKAICLVAVGPLGARIRFRLLPAIRERRRAAPAGWVALGLSVMGPAFGFAAILARSPVLG